MYINDFTKNETFVKAAKMMKRLVIITSILLIGISLAEDNGFVVIPRVFENGMSDFHVPIKLGKDIPTHDLIEKLRDGITSIINNVMLEYYVQASRAKTYLVRDMQSAVEELLFQLEVLHGNSSVMLEKELIGINELLIKVMDCLPKDVEIKPKDLPILPGLQRNISIHRGNVDLSNIFLNLENLVDRDFASIHSIINGVYLAGWLKARLSLTQYQHEFRRDFLYYILTSFSREIRKLNDTTIKNHVTDGTFDLYMQLKANVIKVVESINEE